MDLCPQNLLKLVSYRDSRISSLCSTSKQPIIQCSNKYLLTLINSRPKETLCKRGTPREWYSWDLVAQQTLWSRKISTKQALITEKTPQSLHQLRVATQILQATILLTMPIWSTAIACKNKNFPKTLEPKLKFWSHSIRWMIYLIKPKQPLLHLLWGLLQHNHILATTTIIRILLEMAWIHSKIL